MNRFEGYTSYGLGTNSSHHENTYGVNSSSHQTLQNNQKIDSSRQNQNCRNAVPPTCPIHGSGHSLNQCCAFRMKPISERKKILKKNGYCYRCCGPIKHLSKNCKETVKYIVCRSNRHPSALHEDMQSKIQRN